MPNLGAAALEAAFWVREGRALGEADVDVLGVGRQVDEVVGIFLGESVGGTDGVGGVPDGFDAGREECDQLSAKRPGQVLRGGGVRREKF